MIAFLSSATGKAAMTIVAVVAIAIGLFSLYQLGKSAGKRQERMQMLEQSVKVMRERSAIDDKIENSSDADLCRSLGGMPDNDGKCM